MSASGCLGGLYLIKGELCSCCIMELNDFIEKFAEQFDDTDASEITKDTEYQELEEWSSLTAMGIIAFVKTEYGKSITGREIRYAKTVKELFELIASK